MNKHGSDKSLSCFMLVGFPKIPMIKEIISI